MEGIVPAWYDPEADSHQITPMVICDTEPPDSDHKKRLSSMLYYDNGLVRFRQEGDSEGDPIASTDEELDSGESGPPKYSSVPLPHETLLNGVRPKDRIPRSRHWRYGSRRSTNTGYNTPGTPLSLCSTDLDIISGQFSFRAPSSIHLRDSIDRALNFSDFQLRTPDLLETVESISLPGSPDAMRDSLYSYATACQDSKSGTMSLSPGRKLYSALSFRASTPSLNYRDAEMGGSGWFQKYFWEKFGNRYNMSNSQAGSVENSIDVNLSDNNQCSNSKKQYLPLSVFHQDCVNSPVKERNDLANRDNKFL